MQTTEQRIAALEAEIALLKNPPKRADTEYARYEDPPLDWRKFCKITEGQAEACLNHIRRKYPQVLPNLPIDTLVERFRVTVTAIETRFKRLEAPDRARLVGDLFERVEAAASSIGGGTRLVNELSFPAVIVLGAPYVLPDRAAGRLAAVGIRENVGLPFRPIYDHLAALPEPVSVAQLATMELQVKTWAVDRPRPSERPLVMEWER